ncbi:MAG: hypothetical protein PHY47_01550 [Lachnospiraceae bacterium]|nr:hypothetical protein [Lachnospiraceae bacterium]
MENNTIKSLTNKFKLYEWYYVMVIVGYIMTLVSGIVHPGIIASLLLLLITGQLFFDKQFCMKGTIDYLMALYFIYNLLSGTWCVSFGMPISVFLGEFATAALPMVFYYVGRSITDHLEGFYRKFIIAIFLVCIVGFVLYIFAPEFYLNYLYNLHYISKADAPTMRIRMISVIGSILVGYLSVAAMLASSHIIINSKGKSGKLLLFINCFFAFMSNQRSAMVVAMVVLVYVNLLIFFTFKLLPKKYFAMECGGIIVAFAGICIIYFPAIMKIYYRLVSLPGAIGQRSDQWVGAMNNMANIWLGNGLGANGHRAQGFTDYFIADGGLAKLFCEMGILGTSIFIFMMILIFRKGSKKLVKCSAELGIIAITLLQCIGSNLLEFQLATPIFWFAVGRCASVIMEE